MNAVFFMSQSLFIIGILLFAWACRTFQNRWLAKLGSVAVLGASYLAGYWVLGDSHLGGATAVGLWIVFPWVEILGHVRKLRFPIKSEVKHRFPPPRDVFPDLDEITTEVEAAGFERADDAGWKWEETDHFIRIFYNAEKRLQATISIAQQGDFVFSHANLTTRTTEGRMLVTTNYPFSFTMKLVPQQVMNRCDDVDSFEQMVTSHMAFLERNGVLADQVKEQDPDSLHAAIESDLADQVNHNLSSGVIVRADDGHFRYSWRGCFFLWIQVVKDMIRV
jgi:hypothetical protein